MPETATRDSRSQGRAPPGSLEGTIVSWVATQPLLTHVDEPAIAVRKAYARRVLMAWLPFIGSAFSLAAILTFWIAFYEQPQNGGAFYVSYLLDSADAAASRGVDESRLATIYYEETGEKPRLRMMVPPKGKLLITGLSESGCHSTPIVHLRIQKLPPDTQAARDAEQTYLIDLATVQTRVSRLTVTCNLSHGAADETFSHRTISFANGAPLGGVRFASLKAQPIVLNLAELDGTELLTFRGGRPAKNSPEAELLAASEHVDVRWRQVVREERRDVILVMIGTLIALGAAMLIEASRPRIELAIGRSMADVEPASGPKSS